jgi:hypothetical protein
LKFFNNLEFYNKTGEVDGEGYFIEFINEGFVELYV